MNSNLAKKLYVGVKNRIMERSGLQPRGTHRYSKKGNTFSTKPELRIELPNLSGELRPIIRQFIESYGLGQNCLLVSENYQVRDILKPYYPSVDFEVCDYFTELMAEQDQVTVDYVWDVCCPPPEELKVKKFDSILSQSLLEHVIAPTTAIYNFISMLDVGGYLYLSTHTPSYHYHAYPRDYVRFHHDYFYDMPNYIEKCYGIKSELVELHSRQGVICTVYKRA